MYRSIKRCYKIPVKVKNRIKVIMNYEEYDYKLRDKIVVLLIQEGYRLTCTDLHNLEQQATFYFSKED